MLEVFLLGPFEALESGSVVPLSPLQRNVLAVLALSRGTVVSTERVIDSLWGDRSPAAPRSRVQGLVSEIRRKIGGVLLTRHPGYLLDAADCNTDIVRLDERIRQARRAATPGEAVEPLRDALALWRGDPLDGVSAPGVEVDRARLAELRVGLLEDRFQAELDLGHHAELVAELTAAAAAHPLRERLAGQLMLALFRSNRQADALRVYQGLRDRLADEVGSDPSSDLRQLHGMILRGGPDGPPQAAPPATARTANDTRPAQLPAGVGYFTGRDLELSALTRAMGRAGDDPRVLLVSALGGLGKTALVVRWARSRAVDFADGQIFVDLHGRDPARALTGRSAVGAALTALGVRRKDLPTRADERVALYRTLISGRRVLVVADDAASTAQLLPLVPPTTSSQLVVTSRLRLTDLSAHHAVYRLFLDPLGPDATHHLLERIVGRDRMRDPAAARIVHWCGGYPLAARLVGMKLTARPGQSLASFADELTETAEDLLLGESRGVHAALTSAHRSLSPAAAHLFGRLGLAPTGSVCMRAIAAVAETSLRPLRRLVDELIDVNLLAEVGPDCYRFHDIVHRFARRCGAELVDRDAVDEWMRHRQPVRPAPAGRGGSVPNSQSIPSCRCDDGARPR